MDFSLESDLMVSMTAPSWAQIRDVLERLDGQTGSRVALALEGVGTLTAGGGNNFRYIVIFMPFDDEKDTLTLYEETSEEQEVHLVIEGVLGIYPPSICVHQETLFRVFEYFFYNRTLPRDVVWLADNTDLQVDLDSYFS